VRLTELVAEVVRPYETAGKTVRCSIGGSEGPEPVVGRNVGLLYGLGNLVENAVQFASDSVQVETDWTRSGITIIITDDGAGFPLDLIGSLGEPYLTAKRAEEAADGGPRGGLGLGIFIAKTLLERTGAQLTFRNIQPTGHAQVRIDWPRGMTGGN
jgi:two-component system sensor histidine kinase RegB